MWNPRLKYEVHPSLNTNITHLAPQISFSNGNMGTRQYLTKRKKYEDGVKPFANTEFVTIWQF